MLQSALKPVVALSRLEAKLPPCASLSSMGLPGVHSVCECRFMLA